MPNPPPESLQGDNQDVAAQNFRKGEMNIDVVDTNKGLVDNVGIVDRV